MHQLPGRTPLIVVEVPPTGGGAADDTVLLYGHLDKQPEMEGWREGLGPWTPVLEGDRLYGRGAADDGYAAFASLTAIEAVHAAGGATTRCIVLIEASEESGSPDLPAYVEALATRIGRPSLVVCLDSGCIDYDRMWVTTSLRGLAGGVLSVDIVTEGLHSGDVSGMIPSSFRISRSLLSRIEDEVTGRVLLPELTVEIPADRVREAQATAAAIGRMADHYPFVDDAGPTTDDAVEQLLSRTWRPALSVVGADGLPPTGRAGNVLRPGTRLKLSMRLPPTCDPVGAVEAMRAALVTDPPYGARVTFTGMEQGAGLERARVRPVAGRRPRRGVVGDVRGAVTHVRRGWDDPVHGDARSALPRRPIRDHGCDRPRRECPRAERISPRPDRPAHHGSGSAPARRPRPPRAMTLPRPGAARS